MSGFSSKRGDAIDELVFRILDGKGNPANLTEPHECKRHSATHAACQDRTIVR